MKKLILLGALVLASQTVIADEYDLNCRTQINRRATAQYEYDNFDTLTIRALAKKIEGMRSLRERKTNRPKQINAVLPSTRDAIPVKQSQVDQLNLDIAQTQADLANARVSNDMVKIRLYQAQLKRQTSALGSANAQLSKMVSDVSRWQTELATLAEPPTLPELEQSIRESEDIFHEQENLRSKKLAELNEMKGNVTLCQNYYRKSEAYDYLKAATGIIHLSGCANAQLPIASTSGMYDGRNDALRTMGCL